MASDSSSTGGVQPDSAPAISLQELVGAVERLRNRDRDKPEEHWLAAVEAARDRLALEPFQAEPLDVFVTHSGDRQREITSPRPADRVIEEAIRPNIDRHLKGQLTAAVHGYVRGRSTLTAALALKDSLRDQRAYLAFLDIKEFFPSVSHPLLREGLSAFLPPRLVAIVMALVAAPTRRDGVFSYATRGLPLGRPLSPSLSNLVLTSVDRAMLNQPGTYLRYGDDLALACQSFAERESAEAHLRAALTHSGFEVRESKLRYVDYAGAPVVYLGHAVDAHGVYRKVSQGPKAAAPMAANASGDPVPLYPSVKRRTLYITEPGLYVRIQGGMIVLARHREKLLEVPLRRVERVVVLTHLSVSSGFISCCVAYHIPVFFFVGRGRAYGALVASGLPHPLRLRAQYHLLTTPATRLHLARQIVAAKLAAMRRRLVNTAAARDALEQLDSIGSKLPSCETTEQLRGYEGAATAAYYQGYATRIRVESFAFSKRSRRPPKDRINSLLSFTYSLLFGEMQTALLAHGLDPSPALLHEVSRNHPALASDLMEPYRALIADSFVLQIVKQGTLGAEDFEPGRGGAVLLTNAGRRKLLEAYEAYMNRRGAGGKALAPPRWLIDAAARAMLNVVLGGTTDLILPLVPAADEGDDDAAEASDSRPTAAPLLDSIATPAEADAPVTTPTLVEAIQRGPA